MPTAVTALVSRPDGKFLVVWNKRRECWTLPGGKVEPGETDLAALFRELYEEVRLVMNRPTVDTPDSECARLLYEAQGVLGDGWVVKVFEVRFLAPKKRQPIGADFHLTSEVLDPVEGEEGCPVTWWSRDEFLRWCSPKGELDWAGWYERMFNGVDASTPGRIGGK